MIKTCSAMPRFYPNIQFSDCWSSVGDITYYHRNGICYFRSKAYTEFKGTSEQMVRLGLHKSLDTSNCIDAVKSAITRHGAPEIINSDQGYVFRTMVGH